MHAGQTKDCAAQMMRVAQAAERCRQSCANGANLPRHEQANTHRLVRAADDVTQQARHHALIHQPRHGFVAGRAAECQQPSGLAEEAQVRRGQQQQLPQARHERLLRK